MWPRKPTTTNSHQKLEGARKDSLRAAKASAALSMPWLSRLASSLWENYFYCRKPPGYWWFVGAAIRNNCTKFSFQVPGRKSNWFRLTHIQQHVHWAHSLPPERWITLDEHDCQGPLLWKVAVSSPGVRWAGQKAIYYMIPPNIGCQTSVFQIIFPFIISFIHHFWTSSPCLQFSVLPLQIFPLLSNSPATTLCLKPVSDLAWFAATVLAEFQVNSESICWGTSGATINSEGCLRFF